MPGAEAGAQFGTGLVYLIILCLLVPFGLHRLRLLWLRFATGDPPAPRGWKGPLPPVTIQLPIYNEANVAERLIAAACSQEYPPELLEVQVLDDSDDTTVEIAARATAVWRERGIAARHVRRGTREGFKAGALAHGARLASGEFLLVLDADFVPPPGLIRSLLESFDAPNVGAVQAAWGHLNAGESWLTRAQALFLDAHFAIEHAARHRNGLFFNFNGSAGMWRRVCIEASGGWKSDTLTEDVDLSYRAQLGGWRLVYRDDVRVPAELPRKLEDVELQQERWAQGGIQSALKLLPRVWRSPLRPAVKWEASAHLLGHAVHPLTLILGICLCALGYLGLAHEGIPAWVHSAALGFATLPFLLFYGAAARVRRYRAGSIPRRLFEALILGLALGIPLTGAVLRGALRVRTPFRRTPKRGGVSIRAYRARVNGIASGVRAVLGLSLIGSMASLVASGLVAAVPFTGLFAAGYLAATREVARRGLSH
jgi:cellulose synthase/poly-beta-1,6-N-acetylglucosamine synthase-like glycosyltransferase